MWQNLLISGLVLLVALTLVGVVLAASRRVPGAPKPTNRQATKAGRSASPAK